MKRERWMTDEDLRAEALELAERIEPHVDSLGEKESRFVRDIHDVRYGLAAFFVYLVGVAIALLLLGIGALERTAEHSRGLAERIPFWRSE